MLAALGAIPVAERQALFQTSIRRNQDGSVEVQFPFGVSTPEKSVTVYPADLLPQTVPENGRPVQYRPVSSSQGWQILEAAYVPARLRPGRRMGRSTGRRRPAAPRRSSLKQMVKTKEAEIDVFHQAGGLAKDPAKASRAFAGFDSFDPSVQMMVLGSLDVPFDFVQAGYKISRSHSYVVAGTDPERRLVMLINPHDSTRPMVLGYDDVAQAFDTYRRLELDLEKTFQ